MGVAWTAYRSGLDSLWEWPGQLMGVAWTAYGSGLDRRQTSIKKASSQVSLLQQTETTLPAGYTTATQQLLTRY
ncbi:hypothetical protein DPEC_G00029540 [Dallia pectoralis]|uniref:Uncharacterized protein n=1 Tax=Dallia pectoralis TaxID=75939 RepID=A0ACC2HJ47_DALPE|nr:hypothetical protein DPEC_G00029540 [Dallia pectoralis]